MSTTYRGHYTLANAETDPRKAEAAAAPVEKAFSAATANVSEREGQLSVGMREKARLETLLDAETDPGKREALFTQLNRCSAELGSGERLMIKAKKVLAELAPELQKARAKARASYARAASDSLFADHDEIVASVKQLVGEVFPKIVRFQQRVRQVNSEYPEFAVGVGAGHFFELGMPGKLIASCPPFREGEAKHEQEQLRADARILLLDRITDTRNAIDSIEAQIADRNSRRGDAAKQKQASIVRGFDDVLKDDREYLQKLNATLAELEKILAENPYYSEQAR